MKNGKGRISYPTFFCFYSYYHNITKAGRFCPHFLKHPKNDRISVLPHRIQSFQLVSFQAFRRIQCINMKDHLLRFLVCIDTARKTRRLQPAQSFRNPFGT